MATRDWNFRSQTDYSTAALGCVLLTDLAALTKEQLAALEKSCGAGLKFKARKHLKKALAQLKALTVAASSATSRPPPAGGSDPPSGVKPARSKIS